MKKAEIIFVFLVSIVLSIVLSKGVSANISNEYLTEFNEDSEKCEIIDWFYYNIPNQNFLGSDYKSTVMVLYYCSENDNQGTLIIFDVAHKGFLERKYNLELVDLSRIKYNLNNGILSETNFVSNGFDICTFFGEDKLHQESVNLAAQTTEYVLANKQTETAKNIKSAIQLGKDIGKITKFNPSGLIGSVVCSYTNENLKLAIEKLVTCNKYLSNIDKNYAEYGYAPQLNSCINDAKGLLETYIGSTSAQIIDVVNKGGSAVSGVIGFFVDIIKDPAKIPEIKIEKTELDIAKEVNSKLTIDTKNFENPNKYGLVNGFEERINLKFQQYNSLYQEIKPNYDYVKSIKPSFFKLFLTNWFMEPNYKNKEASKFLNNAKIFISNGEIAFKENKFNTAKNNINNAQININSAKKIILKENNTNRDYDFTAIILSLIVLIIMILWIKGCFKGKNN